MDRNQRRLSHRRFSAESLSARRAWIEIILYCDSIDEHLSRSPQGERG